MKLIKLFLILPIFILLSCSKEAMPMGGSNTVPPIVNPEDFSFLALGDSYTFGSGILEEDSWPFQLVDSLETMDIILDDLEVIAASGWTTDYLIGQIENIQPDVHDLVSLQIGVNDQFQGRTFEEFKSGFDELLETAKTLAGGRENVMVVSIPDYGVTPFGANNSTQIAAELDEFNAYILQQCLAEEIPYVDVTTISRELGDGENALAGDQLHPSGMQYQMWIDEIWPVAKDILEN